MKAIGFNAGQFGDLAMNLAACREFKRLHPNSHLTIGIGNRYAECAPLFDWQIDIDGVHIWDSYNGWPSPKDSEYIKSQKFNKVFNAMPQHLDPHWFERRHQVEEVCHMHGLPTPETTKLHLNRWFDLLDGLSGYVAVAGFTSFGNAKSIPADKLERMISCIKELGFETLQIGGNDEPNIKGISDRFYGNYFDSVKVTLSCKALVAADTGMSWFVSAYDFPVLGLYGWSFYPDCLTSKNWQPVNPKAIYLESDHVSNILDSAIQGGLSKLLIK